MTVRTGLKIFLYLILLCGVAVQTTAQAKDLSEPKILRIQYSGVYLLQDSYSIIYDNMVETAKLKDFRITFYGPGKQKLSQTDIETYPATGKIVTYELDAPVTGFNEVELSILSLHSGKIEASPANMGAILALNEVREVPTPSPARPRPPILLPPDRLRITDTNSQISQILSTLHTMSDEQSNAEVSSSANAEAFAQLITNTNSLTTVALQTEQLGLKAQIDVLSGKLEASNLNNNNTAMVLSESQTKLAALLREAETLKDDIQTLQRQSQVKGIEAATVLSLLSSAELKLETLNADIDAIALPIGVEASEIKALDAEYLALKAQVEASPPDGVVTSEEDKSTNTDENNTTPKIEETEDTLDWRIIAAALLAALALIGAAAKFIFAPKAKAHPPKSALNRGSTPGVIFPASPMLTGNVAAPLAPAGQLASAQLQMLSGPYAMLKQAYLATGRIGYAQDGVPSAKDYSFGTGFLISDRHVVTNRHVHGLYGHYLLDKSDPGGIEFIAEKGKDASDFVPFNGEPPLLLLGLDIAIYTLATPVTNRTPLRLKPIPTEDLHPRDVVLIGYPDTHTPEKAEILAVVEENPIFAVKRISQGQIFRHSTDIDIPIGVETSVSETKSSDFIMPAICHNASTMGGNSGSPVLDIKDGSLVGVHFAGFKVFNQEEAANLAMTIVQLTASKQLKNLSHVTPITAQAFKNS